MRLTLSIEYAIYRRYEKTVGSRNMAVLVYSLHDVAVC